MLSRTKMAARMEAIIYSIGIRVGLYQGRIKEERACNLGNTRIHMWAGECA